MEAIPFPALANVICEPRLENKFQTGRVIGELRVKIFEIIRAHFGLSVDTRMICHILAASIPQVSDCRVSPCGHTIPCAPMSRANECVQSRQHCHSSDDQPRVLGRRFYRHGAGRQILSHKGRIRQSPYRVRICGTYIYATSVTVRLSIILWPDCILFACRNNVLASLTVSHVAHAVIPGQRIEYLPPIRNSVALMLGFVVASTFPEFAVFIFLSVLFSLSGFAGTSNQSLITPPQ
jgi:hypothetical protein